MRQWVIAVLSAGLALAGCAAGDKSMEISGGVAAEQVSADVFRIKSSKNAGTEHVLVIAAETTKGAGATHFKLISASDANRQVDFTAPGSTTTSAVGRASMAMHPIVMEIGLNISTAEVGLAIGKSGAATTLSKSIEPCFERRQPSRC
jgi:hypothetical protein